MDKITNEFVSTLNDVVNKIKYPHSNSEQGAYLEIDDIRLLVEAVLKLKSNTNYEIDAFKTFIANGVKMEVLPSQDECDEYYGWVGMISIINAEDGSYANQWTTDVYETKEEVRDDALKQISEYADLENEGSNKKYGTLKMYDDGLAFISLGDRIIFFDGYEKIRINGTFTNKL